MRCFHCNNLNLYPEFPEQTAGALDQARDYTITLQHSGRCEAIGVALTAIIPEGLELISATTEKGYWSLTDRSVQFVLGRVAAGSTVSIGLTLHAARPGVYGTKALVRSTSETGGALADNQFTLTTTVPGLALVLDDAASLRIHGYPAEASFLLERSQDLRTWTRILTNRLSGGEATISLDRLLAPAFYRARTP